MKRFGYTKGLHDLGNGCWAWLLPDGSWGYSNAGLIEDGGESLLVDTLFDLELTGEMLQAMRASIPAAKSIGRLVNTHANGDHTFGNQLVRGAEIIASRASAEEMDERPVEFLAERMRNWRQLGDAGWFLHESMGRKFKFDNIVHTPPTRTFEDTLTLQVGGKRVELINVGPAHTRGDVLVHVPAERTVFTGDILFVGGHPAIWAGPVANWIAACDRILAWDVETVVPGHGPITDKAGVRALKTYLEQLRDEARKRFNAGLSREAAAEEIVADFFPHWMDRERIFINVDALYREFQGEGEPPDVTDIFGQMGRWYRRHVHAHD